MTALIVSTTFVLADWWEFGFYRWFALVGVSVLLLGSIGAAASVQIAATLLLVTWLILVGGQVVEWAQGDETPINDFATTVLLPFGLTSAAVWVASGRRLTAVARSAPFLLPVTLAVLVLPLLSEDLWDALAGFSLWSGVFLVLLTLVPVTVIFIWRLRAEVSGALNHANARTTLDEPTLEAAVGRLTALVDEDRRAEVSSRLQAELPRYVEAGGSDEVRAGVAARLGRRLRSSLGHRALTTVIGLWIAVSMYLYLLAIVLVSTDVAKRWMGQAPPTERIGLPTGAFELPAGPYLSVALVLGVLATAVLLAFVLTEDRYGEGLARVLLKEPLEAGMPVALLYRALRDEVPLERDSIPKPSSSSSGP